MITQQEKIQIERRRKGAPLIMSRSSKTELRFSKNGGILYGFDEGAPNGVICGAPFLLLFWSSVTISLGAPLLLLSWSSVTTPLLELRYYSSYGAPLQHPHLPLGVTLPRPKWLGGWESRFICNRC